ncbi:MAG: Ig-like domain-containing protein, partial [Paracoccaceae bacterium]
MTLTLLGTIASTDPEGSTVTLHSIGGVFPSNTVNGWPYRYATANGDLVFFQNREVYHDDLGVSGNNPPNGTTSTLATLAITTTDGSAVSATRNWTFSITGFVVTDVTPPTIVATIPADNATGVGVSQVITIEMSESVAFGTGNITLRTFSGTWSDAEVFNVATAQGTGAGQVSISGSIVTIRPTSPYANSRQYAVRVDATAIQDLAGNAFAGVADDTTISFTTVAASGSLTVNFGQYTRAGAGGVAVTGTSISTGDASGHWQIVSGYLSPSTAGQGAISGSYSLTLNDAQTVAITVTSNEYHVRTVPECSAAFTHAGTAGGRTITFRNEVIATTGSRLARNKTFTSTMVVRGEAGHVLRGTADFAFENAKNVRLEDVVVNRIGATSGAVINLVGACDDFEILRCEAYGNVYDPFTDFSAGGYSNCNGIG